ncbi:NAD(P)-binding protein [Delitschia confertaspora ATCC 74209]|uniref:NAD(P)-binding protein n=1 Tax=Delitschia confertaspora ATCC 74209 TaxID=1513339 RepID=A0A9P4JR78_9PLEO|nr:NAD(P)-binding protein [Delitschia confertaspora ATCC 74209]
MSSQTILITGASGFVGQTLAKALLLTYSDLTLVLADVNTPPNPVPEAKNNVHCLSADLTSPSTSTSLITTHKPTTIYILHGIMSSGAEANLELGLKVNFDSVRTLLDIVRRHQPGTKVIFTSSCAVNGRLAVSAIASETSITPMPESSYGTQKLMIELLINDYSRRGEIDGRVVRLPTIFVRRGAPTAAASSFVSGIVREPVHGEESELPVSPDIGVWLSSPSTLAKNLIHAMTLPAEKFGHFRTVLLPGFTATSGEILNCLENVVGREARKRVKEKRDPVIERIVKSWPAQYDTSRARELKFFEDGGLKAAIKEFVQGEES